MRDWLKQIRCAADSINNDHGIALMVVMWVSTLLIVVAFAFSMMVRTEMFSTMTFQEQMAGKYLAEAGFNRAIMEMIYRNVNKNNTISQEGVKIITTDGSFYDGETKEGHYRFAVMDETGKININLLSDATAIMLNNLLINLGVEKDQADTIVDSILDWKDADDLHRLHGAESDYYMSLPNPYKAKDAKFDNLEELALVKGVTREILFGAPGRPGLIRFLTVHTSSSLINIHTASLEVLRAIPLMTEEMIQSISVYRTADNEKKDGSGLQSMLVPSDYAKISSYVTTADSNTYSVEAIGYKTLAAGHYAVKAVVRIESADRYSILYYQSPSRIERPENEQSSTDTP